MYNPDFGPKWRRTDPLRLWLRDECRYHAAHEDYIKCVQLNSRKLAMGKYIFFFKLPFMHAAYPVVRI